MPVFLTSVHVCLGVPGNTVLLNVHRTPHGLLALGFSQFQH